MNDTPNDSREFRPPQRDTFSSAPPETPAPSTKRRQAKSTREHFTEATVNAQFKLPRDLVASLRLHSIATGKTMSELVLDTLTSENTVSKAWISTKRAA